MPLPDTILFHVTEPRKGVFVIEWLVRRIVPEDVIEKAGALTGFLYWAETQGVLYSISQPLVTGKHVRKPALELSAVGATWGERQSGIFCDFAGLYRVISGGTHYLTHHGISGLPAPYLRRIEELDRKGMCARFLIEPRDDGPFLMTLADWWEHLASGCNHLSLRHMAVSQRALEIEQRELPGGVL